MKDAAPPDILPEMARHFWLSEETAGIISFTVEHMKPSGISQGTVLIIGRC